MTHQQRAVLAYVAANPGCSIADVCRHEWKGQGHAASYARVARLVARGHLVARKGVGKRVALTVKQRE